MSPSQIGWLCMMVSAICTGLLGEAELLTPREHHIVALIAYIATAISGFMLQRPGSQAYFIVGEQTGLVKKTDRAGFEQHARESAEQQMPQPLPRPVVE